MEEVSNRRIYTSDFSNLDSLESPPSSSLLHPEEERGQPQVLDNHRGSHLRPPSVPHRLSISVSDVTSTAMREDVCTYLFVLVTFWFFMSLTVILGFFGSENISLSPSTSRLIRTSPLFVQTIQVEETDGPKQGPMLFGFHELPSLDVKITWSETHSAFIQSCFHKEWLYFLNRGSKVGISYSVNSPSDAPLSLVIAQGRENLANWLVDPSYPNTTLSWNIIHGNGVIHQEISKSEAYYIAVGNLNSDEVGVQLNFTIQGLIYNTSQSYYSCSLSHRLCRLKLSLLKESITVLTSPRLQEGVPYDYGHVKLSYGPRLITYVLGSGTMTVLLLLAFRICSFFQILSRDRAELQASETAPERVPLLPHKDDDLSSWGSSYDSLSHEDVDECLPVSSQVGITPEGESNSHSLCLCAVCFDAPRDCFFLPCGHCATCFTCGKRIAEEAGACPICCRKMKKVRMIYSV